MLKIYRIYYVENKATHVVHDIDNSSCIFMWSPCIVLFYIDYIHSIYVDLNPLPLEVPVPINSNLLRLVLLQFLLIFPNSLCMFCLSLISSRLFWFLIYAIWIFRSVSYSKKSNEVWVNNWSYRREYIMDVRYISNPISSGHICIKMSNSISWSFSSISMGVASSWFFFWSFVFRVNIADQHQVRVYSSSNLLTTYVQKIITKSEK